MMMERQEYFIRPDGVWFPDFAQALDYAENRFTNYPGGDFACMTELVAFFRGELSRERFAAGFLAAQPPQKTLRKDRGLYQQVKELCTAFGEGAVSPAEFDERLYKCFRGRPEENVFVPEAAAREEAEELLRCLTGKGKRLPVDFDGINWSAFLLGNITRRQFAELICASNAAERLAQGPTYGNDKEGFARTYAREITTCARLHRLCADYRDGYCVAADFDARFLELAKEFCAS